MDISMNHPENKINLVPNDEGAQQCRKWIAVFGFLTATLSGCAMLAPADDVNGTVALEAYSVQGLKALITEGKTNV
jgi:hypothetical protein